MRSQQLDRAMWQDDIKFWRQEMKYWQSRVEAHRTDEKAEWVEIAGDAYLLCLNGLRKALVSSEG